MTVAIVGAGPAGLGALLELVERGVECSLVDEAAEAGGQGWHPERSVPGAKPRSSASRRLGRRTLARLAELDGRFEGRFGTAAVAVYPGPELVLDAGEAVTSLHPRAVLLATGARDRVLPFPGWTLPGVMSLGGLLGAIERHGLRPQVPVVLAGAGPLLLLAAARLSDLGHPPLAVFDAVDLLGLAPGLPGMVLRPSLLSEGWDLLARIGRGGASVARGWAVVGASGRERVQHVRVAPVDRGWRPDLERGEVLDAGLLAVGHGLAPEIALAAQAGVSARWSNELGGWLPEHGPDQQTSVEGLWVAGDGCGVHGAEVAWLQGRIAGLSMARHVGAAQADDSLLLDDLHQRLAVWLRARTRLEQAMQPWPGLLENLDDDTVLCRCEEVTLGELQAWTERGLDSPVQLKMATRAGMGRCQGRFCQGVLRDLLAIELGDHARVDDAPSPRPPVRPVRIRDLASWES